MKRTIVALSFMVILNPVYEIMEMKGLYLLNLKVPDSSFRYLSKYLSRKLRLQSFICSY